MLSMNNKMMDRFFRKVDNVVWDLMSGKVGVRTSEGICTIEGEGDEAQITINPFDQFGMEVPAFAQNTPLAAVNVGDLIYSDKKLVGWVIDKKPKGFVVMTQSGTRTTFVPPKVQMFGLDSGVLVLRSLSSMLPGGTAGLTNMQGMLMPMLMMGGDQMDLSPMMAMMMMSGNALGGSADPAAANSGMQQAMQTMLMMQMFKGSGAGSAKMTGGKSGYFS